MYQSFPDSFKEIIVEFRAILNPELDLTVSEDT